MSPAAGQRAADGRPGGEADFGLFAAAAAMASPSPSASVLDGHDGLGHSPDPVGGPSSLVARYLGGLGTFGASPPRRMRPAAAEVPSAAAPAGAEEARVGAGVVAGAFGAIASAATGAELYDSAAALGELASALASSSSSSSSSSRPRSRSPPRGALNLRLPLLPPPPLGLPGCSAGAWCRPGDGAEVVGSIGARASQAVGAAEGSAPSRAARRKRSPDDLALLCELPPREAAAVSSALEQWGSLRHRVKALEPTLRREGALVQEILDTGLRDENRRTLRKLTQSSASGDVEETIQQVCKAIGANRERLERILERNHGELVRLSTTAVSDLKEDVLREVDEVLSRLKRALAAVRCELLASKERSDMTAVRRTGRSFNDLKALVRRLDDERRLITRNSALAALLVTVCRRVLPVRQVDPSALRDIPPSCEGYRRIMEFYFFTDAGLYFFGDYPSGPNWFVRLKRNVAILLVKDADGRVVYNHFAVSGEHRAPGAAPAPAIGPLSSMEAEDEHGRVFNRQHDAEFKLLSGFCSAAPACLHASDGSPVAGTGTLWSRKPLCRSCLGAVQQVRVLFPLLRLSVSVGAACTCLGPLHGPSAIGSASSQSGRGRGRHGRGRGACGRGAIVGAAGGSGVGGGGASGCGSAGGGGAGGGGELAVGAGGGGLGAAAALEAAARAPAA